MAKKYQMGNQKAYIEVRQTIQWPTKRYQKGNQKAQIKVGQTIHRTKDTKGVIRRYKSK